MTISRKHLRHGQPPPQPREWPPGDTKTTLPADLETKPPDYVRDQLIKRARAGHYHDFETQLASPKLTLYKHLLQCGYQDLAQKVRDGGYDHESPTEAEKDEMMRGLLGEKEAGS